MRRTREHQGIIILLYGMHTIILFRDDTDPKTGSLRCHETLSETGAYQAPQDAYIRKDIVCV